MPAAALPNGRINGSESKEDGDMSSAGSPLSTAGKDSVGSGRPRK